MYIFRPFGLYGFPDRDAYILIVKYIGYPLVIWFIILNICSVIIKRPYTIIATMLLMLLLLVISGLTTYFVWANYFDYQGINYRMIYNFVLISVYTGFMPITLIIVFHSNYKLNKQLKEIIQINNSITDNIATEQGNSKITILSREQNKEYTVNSDEIVYIQSQDNYVKIVTNNNNSVKLDLIRTTLSYAEKDIQHSCKHIIRCHNSYIVNLNMVKRAEGNSAGYKLHINDNSEIIPVSRKYVGDVRAYFKNR